MGDAGTGGGAGPDEDDDVNEGFTPDLASFSANVTGTETGFGTQSDGIGADSGIGSIGTTGDETDLPLTANEPKATGPVSERVSAIKKKAKRRSILGGEPSNVYRRSILGN